MSQGSGADTPIFGGFKTKVVSGVLVLVPLAATFYLLRGMFNFVAGILLPVIDPAVEGWPPIWRDSLSVVVLLVLVYLVGLLAAHVAGRRVLTLMDGIFLRLPVVRTIYRATKQVADAFEGSNTKAFKSVVLIEFPRTGVRSLGFLTSRIESVDGRKWCMVFVPTTPNPTSGFLQAVPEDDLIQTKMTVEDAMKTIISLGVLVPPGTREDLTTPFQGDVRGPLPPGES
jgi:uncharacterized membrane protein